ncbi:competence type IV pilus minor pilin ComGD [Streptococcus halichoeri]|uniref:competence type IV pilus minor pilin ComGD n=1 Tax=Streptococcus halichoeri TaxID=254785 RepID=UPI00135C5042|nr:competence type IV pilus minor pilin ComGD [Streptococcus halichoeri]
MPNTQIQKPACQLPAFSLAESLVVLLVITSMTLLIPGPWHDLHARVEEQLFFLSFEQCYRHAQKMAVLSQSQGEFVVEDRAVTFEGRKLTLPRTVIVKKPMLLRLNTLGGHHSLGKIQFLTPHQEISYQLMLGSGNYKKTEHQRLHTP